MSSYILMKILESVPNRYDKGMKMLSHGRLEKSYDRLTSFIHKGDKVLDIGAGTGALTLRSASKAAFVKAIDINPQILEVAQKKINAANMAEKVQLCEMGIAELESEKSESYDKVESSLCFSELSKDELEYCLKEIKRILKPEGLLLIADETVATHYLKRVIGRLLRIPLVLITYILTQTTTKAVKNLPEKLKNAGFIVKNMRLNKMENFIEIVAKKDRSL